MATKIWTGATSEDFTVATNWKGGIIPLVGDDVVFNSGAINVSLGLTPPLVLYASFTVTNDYTGLIGLESDFLKINSTLVDIGGSTGAGSRRLNLDLGTVVSAITITSSNGTGADTNRAPIRILCNNVATNFFISGSSSNVALFDEPDTTGNTGAINILAGNLETGKGLTYTAFNISGSGTTVTIAEPTAASTITMDNGTATVSGDNAIAAVVQRGGTYISNSSGIITAYTQRGGIADFQQSDEPRTVTTFTQSPLNTILKHNEGVLTLTNYVRDTDYKLYNISMTEA